MATVPLPCEVHIRRWPAHWLITHRYKMELNLSWSHIVDVLTHHSRSSSGSEITINDLEPGSHERQLSTSLPHVGASVSPAHVTSDQGSSSGDATGSSNNNSTRRRGVGAAASGSSLPAVDAPGPVHGESTAESAERHRLNSPGGIDAQVCKPSAIKGGFQACSCKLDGWTGVARFFA